MAEDKDENNAAKVAKPKAAKPIKDVAPPGESAPSPNSKSVIISNRQVLKDPMVRAKTVLPQEDKPSGDESKKKPDDDKLLTAPLLEAEGDGKPVVSNKAGKPPAPSKPEAKLAEAKKPEEQKEPEQPEQSEKPEEPKETPADNPDEESGEETVEKSVDDKSSSDKTRQAEVEAEAEEEAQRQAVLQKLTENKKYYLPINSVEKRKAKHFVILGLLMAVILAAAWADVALDAGLVHIDGVKAPTHFFSN